MESLRVGIVQMQSTADPWQNLAVVHAFVQEAVAQRCAAVFFPENVFYRGPKRQGDFDRAQIHLDLSTGRVAGGDFARAVAENAAQWPVHVSLGSVLEAVPGVEKPYNTHLWLAPGGQVAASYRKIHLFDYSGSAGRYHESGDVNAGTVAKSTELGAFRVGLAVCYDLRFPELFRSLTLQQHCDVLTLPAAFTRETGKAHWHALLRARAIENQSYVLAAAQWGSHTDSKGQHLYCYGHALAYDPWGELLVDGADEGDALVVAELSKERLKDVRGRLPCLDNASYFNKSFQGA